MSAQNQLRALVPACALGLMIVLSVCMHRHRKVRATRATMRSLLRSIHDQVSYLAALGCNALTPHEDDRHTAHVLIRIERCGTAIIEKVGRNGTNYRYSVRENGLVLRSVIGATLTGHDYQWCHDELTPARLEYLLAVLRGTYSPSRVPTVS